VTDFRGPTLPDDLADRDFTVNALAVPVRGLAGGAAVVVDPRGGLADLRRRRLRLATPDAIARDPVRALRGIRLEALLRFRLDAGAARAIRRDAAALGRVAAERVAQEIVAILRLAGSASVVRRAEGLGVLAAVIPETVAMRGVTQPPPHRFDVLEHSLRTLMAADRLVARIGALGPWGDLIATHLAEPLGGGVTRREALKLAALLHDVAKPETRAVIDGRIRFFGHDGLGAERVRAVGERLRLPASATRIVETLVRHHLRPMHLEQAGQVTRRARYRFFRDLGDESRDLLLLTLADAAAVRGLSPFAVWRRSGLVRELMAGWQEDREARAVPSLLRGEDVMGAFGLAPGPAVGQLLARAREAQDTGLVATREQALAHLRISLGRRPLPPEEGSVI
jgi:poly(A) polymerase